MHFQVQAFLQQPSVPSQSITRQAWLDTLIPSLAPALSLVNIQVLQERVLRRHDAAGQRHGDRG